AAHGKEQIPCTARTELPPARPPVAIQHFGDRRVLAARADGPGSLPRSEGGNQRGSGENFAVDRCPGPPMGSTAVRGRIQGPLPRSEGGNHRGSAVAAGSQTERSPSPRPTAPPGCTI